MKIKNLIWGGCSFSAGSSFTSNPNWHTNNESIPFEFAHDGLKKYFKPPYTVINIKNQIKNISFPIQLGKKMGCEVIKNFSVSGMGYPINTRKIFSYLITNPDNINFKETVVGIQLTSFQRDEVIKEHTNGDIEFSYLDGDSCENHSKEYITKYWNATYSVIKSLYDLTVFKGWCHSLGINVHYFCFDEFLDSQIITYTSRYEKMIKQINVMELTHDNIDFPSMDIMLKNLKIIQLPLIENGTFLNDGFHNDNHFSPNGHRIVSDIIFDIFKNRLKYEI